MFTRFFGTSLLMAALCAHGPQPAAVAAETATPATPTVTPTAAPTVTPNAIPVAGPGLIAAAPAWYRPLNLTTTPVVNSWLPKSWLKTYTQALDAAQSRDAALAPEVKPALKVRRYVPARGFFAQATTSQTQTPDATKAATPQTPAPASAAPESRALPDPIDNPPFPFSAWTTNSGYPIGENWDVPPGPLQHALFGTKYDKTPYRIVGWLDAGANISSSKNSNLPLTYDLVPNKLELDQLVFEFQKMPDTVQKKHIDWGFLSAHLFGIDYRFTTAAGWVGNDQLARHNNLYGYDPVLQWFMVYFPKIQDGAVMQVGRYISPIDIEAQLSNQNYLYSHSLMFGVDPYTYTGINLEVRINKEFEYFVGVHAGNENSPWSGRALPNAELLLGWSSADNKDQLWGGLDSIGSGKTIKGHDNEQVLNGVWGHVWNKRLHMQTQSYYMWQYEPVVGGTPLDIHAETYSYAPGGGPVTVVPGKANAYGFVNNLEYKVNNRDYITFRSGYLGDPQGWRTGVKNRYCDFTLGYSHLFNSHIWFRPEIGFQHGFDADAFDNGTKRDQVTAAADIIYRF